MIEFERFWRFFKRFITFRDFAKFCFFRPKIFSGNFVKLNLNGTTSVTMPNNHISFNSSVFFSLSLCNYDKFQQTHFKIISFYYFQAFTNMVDKEKAAFGTSLLDGWTMLEIGTLHRTLFAVYAGIGVGEIELTFNIFIDFNVRRSLFLSFSKTTFLKSFCKTTSVKTHFCSPVVSHFSPNGNTTPNSTTRVPKRRPKKWESRKRLQLKSIRTTHRIQ